MILGLVVVDGGAWWYSMAAGEVEEEGRKQVGRGAE